MYYNTKIKHAVTLAASIISLGLQGNAYALGLSDVQIKSYLGQPLKANINVYGANEITDASCFKTGPTSSLSNLKFKLGAIKGNQAALTVTTSQIINEPIVNLSVVSSCGSQFQRDYVVLLDPLLTTEVNTASLETLSIVEIADEKLTSSSIVNTKQPARKTTTAKKATTAKKKRSNKKAKVTHKPPKSNSNTNKGVRTTSAKKATISQPRLSISGTAPVLSANAIGLRLDKQLSFKPNPNALPIENNEIQDEVTAMNNRLAYLAQQVTSLQKQNDKLVSANKQTSQLLEEESANNKLANLLSILGVGVVLLGSYFTVNWLRRRKKQMIMTTDGSNWIDLGKKQDTNTNEFEKSSEKDNSTGVGENANTNSEDEINVSDVVNNTLSTNDSLFEEEEEAELPILDQVDVFLTHGRSSLAIQLLQNHLLDHPKQSVTIWLSLLDLLAKDNSKALYEQAKADCQQHFNVKISDFNALTDTDGSENNTVDSEKDMHVSIESYPRVIEELQSIWGKPASVVFLDDLIYNNNRLENRDGFEKDVIEELLFLKTIVEKNIDSAEVIQLDEKKIALKKEKEALIATKKAEKIEKMNQQALKEQKEKLMNKDQTTEEETFEFELIESN